MISNYTKVFSISIYHTYFNNQIDTLVLNPSDKTKRLIHSYGLKLIKSENSFQFYDQSDNGFNELLKHIKQINDMDTFKFDIINSDPYFYNYTKIPIDFNGTILFSSSNPLNQKNNDTVLLQPQFITTSNSQKIGEIHLKFSDLKSENPINFDIKFEARSVYWQYYLINSTQVNTDNLQLVSHSNIEFSEPQKTIIENGDNALLVSSKVPIPLNEIAMHKFDLVNHGSNPEILISGLPVPSPSQIKISKNVDEIKIYSPMYIYL